MAAPFTPPGAGVNHLSGLDPIDFGALEEMNLGTGG
jgi:hypothetical protein